MSLKLFLDCVLTGEPAKCSSTVQFVEFVKRSVALHDDWFFYWAIPDWVSEEQFKAAYPQHDRVRYFRVPQHKDRTKEYLTFRDRMDSLIAFNGEVWDFDILVTVRTGLVPLMRLIATSPRQYGKTWLKQFWVIEEMPLMDFKKTVMTIDEAVQDRFTIEGYLAADRVWVCSYHEKPEILQRARDFYGPSMVRQLDSKIKPFMSMQVNEFAMKPKAEWWTPASGRKFCAAYVGRMEMGNNIVDVADLMQKQFVMKGQDIKLLVCTQSKVTKVFDQSVIDVRQASREEFWHLAKTQMDVLVKLEPEGGFALSLFEPLMFGVPAIIKRASWSLALMGASYPFFVNNETEAYAYVSMFHADYEMQYTRWLTYMEAEFLPLMAKRFETDLLYDNLDKAAVEFTEKMPVQFREKYPAKSGSMLVKTIAKHVKHKQEFVLFEAVQELTAAGEFHTMGDKTKDGDRDRRHLAWSEPWNDLRAAFKHLLDWEDASTTIGHLKRGAQS
jgi:hypothetical protein